MTNYREILRLSSLQYSQRTIGYAHGNEDDRYGSGVRQPVERPHVQ